MPEATVPHGPAPCPAGPVPFSLFEGDLINRLFLRMGLRARRLRDLLGRSVVVIAVTWVPLAGLAAVSQADRGGPGANFFLDVAAYLQMLVGLPLFVLAERIIGEHTRGAADYFVATGVVPGEDAPTLEGYHRRLEGLRRWMTPDLVCLVVAFSLSLATILPERSTLLPTWHATGPSMPKALTWAGWWEMLVALPVLNYWWLRWIWKIGLWGWYLFRVSRFRLGLVATHPDATGGIAFLSDVQTKFGLVILAYGVSNVASTVGYKVGVEHASWSLPSVWGPLVGFVVGAPLLFTAPLFMFTKELYRTKKRARMHLYAVGMARARAFEARWRDAPPSENVNVELVAWQQLRTLHDHIEKMRVVPFDLRSFAELMGQTLGALVPLVGYLNIPEPLLKALEGGSKLLR